MHDLTANLFRVARRRRVVRQGTEESQRTGALAGCGPLVIAFVLAWRASIESAPWIRMVWLSLSIYGGMKWLTWYRVVRHAKVRSIAKSFGYLVAWPGMDATRFFDEQARPARPSGGEWCFAMAKTLAGLAILWKGWPWLLPSAPMLAGWMGLGGLVLMLHFGLFHLLALFWQRLGVDARPIMDWPLLAQSPSDFWSRRWNRAFRDIAFGIAFLRLARRLGGSGVILTIFAASGVVHDLVISVPARAGYGLPTIYFLIQGLAVLFERSKFAERLGLVRGTRGRAFAAAIVLLPAGLLFHPPFIHRVVLPLLQAMRIG
jgi:alginate O-acetyltransferase complex protein AlgI